MTDLTAGVKVPVSVQYELAGLDAALRIAVPFAGSTMLIRVREYFATEPFNSSFPLLSPCCGEQLHATRKGSTTAGFYSKDWSCMNCSLVYGDEPWYIRVSNEEEQWRVADLGALAPRAERQLGVLTSAIFESDLIALLEDIANWVRAKTDTYETEIHEAFRLAADHFSGSKVWTVT